MIKNIEYIGSEVRLALEGVVTSKDIEDANAEMYQHPDFTNFRTQLWVIEPLDDIVLSAGDLQRIAQQDTDASQINPHMKVAIYSKSPLAFGLGRMYQAFAENNAWDVSVFYDLAQAELWLQTSNQVT